MDGVRPALRGWVHGLAVPFAVTGLWALWRAVEPLAPMHRVPALAYGSTVVLLFLTSATYHLPARWTPTARARLVRLDGVATLLLIVGTFLPIAAYALEGAWRGWSLAGAAVVGLPAAVLAGSRIVVRPALAASGYVLAGWGLAIPLWRAAATTLAWQGWALLAAGGIVYSLGAVVFARRRPDPVPDWFGFHEVFHVLVIAAAVLHFVAIYRYVLPLAA
jgi:hemolysin III